jgi:hypothetical protein
VHGKGLRSARRLTIDYGKRLSEIELVDGTVIIGKNEAVPADDDDLIAAFVRRASYDARTRTVTLTLANGDDVVARLGTSLRGIDGRDGRPTVYLDQNHWITLAQRLHSPEKVSPHDLEPSSRLIEYARAGTVILPLSGAHLAETRRTVGRRREHLASLMLELSHGWQMRNPLRVRRDELRATFVRQRAGALDESQPLRPLVFGLDPGIIFGARSLDLPSRKRAGRQAAGSGELVQRLAWACSLYLALLTVEADHRPDGARLADLWAHSHNELAQHLRHQQVPRVHLRKISLLRVITDLRDDVAAAGAEAGLDDVQFQVWLKTGADRDFALMPYLGRVREATHHRLRNADDHWEANDLYDLHFLACAAGYADLVAGEGHAANYLTVAGRKRTDGAPVVKSLPALMERLESLLTTPAGQGAAQDRSPPNGRAEPAVSAPSNDVST